MVQVASVLSTGTATTEVFVGVAGAAVVEEEGEEAGCRCCSFSSLRCCFSRASRTAARTSATRFGSGSSPVLSRAQKESATKRGRGGEVRPPVPFRPPAAIPAVAPCANPASAR